MLSADPSRSGIWRLLPGGAPARSGPGHFGANGVEFHDGAVWVSDTDRGTLLRVPVTAAGAPGPVEVIAGGLAGVDDFEFPSACSDVAIVALNGQDEMAVVYPDGRTKIALTAADGLDSPTDTAIRGTRIFITDGGDAAPHDAKVQSGRIDIAALLAGAALTR